MLDECLSEFLVKLGGQARGLKGFGFHAGHVESLVEGTLPQQRVPALAPNTGGRVDEERSRRGASSRMPWSIEVLCERSFMRGLDPASEHAHKATTSVIGGALSGTVTVLLAVRNSRHRRQR